ncbi:MAG TPA: hypothetical protein VKB46_15910 [Pyrinomonadaceae bacterium]|nr:hypothetical protein [Pyrinomonadaceae bacterium]
MSLTAPPLPVRPIWKLDLNHGARVVKSTPDAKRVAIALDKPAIFLVNGGPTSTETISLSEPARHIAINSRGDSLALVTASQKLQLLGLESGPGQRIVQLDSSSHDACEFSRDDLKLWTVGLLSDHIAEIVCYDARTLLVIARHQFTPRVGGCGFILTNHPREDMTGLWVCGGPDEIWNYWIRLSPAGIELQYQPELDGMTPPAFNANGDRFAALNGYDLSSFSFPSCESLGESISLGTDDSEADMFAESMSYLSDASTDCVLASTTEGRIFIVSLEQEELIAEIMLEGHEPKPCYQVYTSLAKTDDRPCSDLHAFIPAYDNLILSVHTNGHASNRQDTVLLWRVPSVGP